MRLLIVVVTGWLLSFCAPALAQNAPAACATADHKAFDFWIGEWNVHTPDGKLAGTNSIKKDVAGCVLHESYNTGRGFSGQSFTMYDASRNVWHQTWVDSAGALLVLEGGLRDGKMILEGHSTNPDQTITKQKISWTLNADGSVRQLWESAGPDGLWTVVFDGKYSRK